MIPIVSQPHTGAVSVKPAEHIRTSPAAPDAFLAALDNLSVESPTPDQEGAPNGDGASDPLQDNNDSENPISDIKQAQGAGLSSDEASSDTRASAAEMSANADFLDTFVLADAVVPSDKPRPDIAKEIDPAQGEAQMPKPASDPLAVEHSNAEAVFLAAPVTATSLSDRDVPMMPAGIVHVSPAPIATSVPAGTPPHLSASGFGPIIGTTQEIADVTNHPMAGGSPLPDGAAALRGDAAAFVDLAAGNGSAPSATVPAPFFDAKPGSVTIGTPSDISRSPVSNNSSSISLSREAEAPIPLPDGEADADLRRLDLILPPTERPAANAIFAAPQIATQPVFNPGSAQRTNGATAPQMVQPTSAGLDFSADEFEFVTSQPSSAPGASHIGKTAASAPAGAPPSVIVQQVADAIRGTSEKTFEITLSPEELGRVRMTLTATEAGMSIQIAAERDETLSLLRRHAELLSEALGGLDLGTVDIGFQQDDGDSHPNPESTATAGDHPSNAADEMAGPLSHRILTNANDRLDIRL